MKPYLKSQLESYCVAAYSRRWQDLEIRQRLEVEDAFMAGAVTMAKAIGTRIPLELLIEEIQDFHERVAQRYREAGLM